VIGVLALVFGFLVLVLLLLVAISVIAARNLASLSDSPLPDDLSELAPCPPEYSSRIFSSDDSMFVASSNSPQLQKLFRAERKAVALLWVRQTSAAMQRVFREHTRHARASEDLEFATEVKLFGFYVELMLLCGLLFVAIQLGGPFWLRGLALYADAHSQRLAQVQQSFKAAASPRELDGAGVS
jgi:hypothetical protein